MAVDPSSITFFSTKSIECPVCQADVTIEKLRGKRVNAGEYDDELRRQYTPTEKYGKVYPLIYSIVVCPECYYATFPSDFLKLKGEKDGEIIKRLASYAETRKENVTKLLGEVPDFTTYRTLFHGAASYVFSTATYSFLPPNTAPTFKRGISSLRAAWLFDTLSKEYEEDAPKYSYIRDTFYLKAEHYYNLAIEHEQKGAERLENVENMGPDTDNDYRYDGVKYISSILSYKLAFLEPNPEIRIKKYQKMKSTMGRLFGFGKTSKEKPGPILEKAKDLYDKIQASIKELEESVN